MTAYGSAKKCLQRVKNYQPGKPIEELEREYGIKNVIKMASNENALGPSPKACAAIRRNLGQIHRYPDGGCYFLRQKLAKRLGVRTDQLIFGNGSDELLVFPVRAFVESRDEVIIADPSFLIYEIAAQVEDAVVVKVPAVDFRYDLNAMARKINSKTKLIFIANPDNPIGTYISRKTLSDFLRKVPSRVVVVLDEAYYEFAQDKKDYPESLKLLKQFNNLIVTRSFSKIYGLGGMRVGYAIADSELIALLNKVREPFNVNLLGQMAACAALDDRDHVKRTLHMVEQGRRFLTKELTGLGCRCVETVTNFMLVDLNREALTVYEALLKLGVIVRPMTVWGLKRFIRVTIGRPQENRRFIKRLKEILAVGDEPRD